ncbi:MAG: hypothetical protein PVG71_06010 [Anaerolineae bacterium]|jgi:hypothetical protein
MKRLLRENWLTILVLAVVIGGYVFLRTPGDDLPSTAAFDERVSGGRPTLVEFFSNT